MFAVTPYLAERIVFGKNPDAPAGEIWQRCLVVGIARDVDGDPVFVVEVNDGGSSYLSFEDEVRRLDPVSTREKEQK
ncbi:hypothetical protein [Ciceribacter sp. L1K22]|uniref:hypothetical protein n=1 Tax=Ciceribacter sp. L1K22 TaxID=2820275 RepID=UPI001ABEE844|nr:hypothetical protein [Ciceribacter sp. L1K22]MBO3760033.1 hypothetical protein [Ciceribacter sp. L1K22]